jgi:hypothetical protein
LSKSAQLSSQTTILRSLAKPTGIGFPCAKACACRTEHPNSSAAPLCVKESRFKAAVYCAEVIKNPSVSVFHFALTFYDLMCPGFHLRFSLEALELRDGARGPASKSQLLWPARESAACLECFVHGTISAYLRVISFLHPWGPFGFWRCPSVHFARP